MLSYFSMRKGQRAPSLYRAYGAGSIVLAFLLFFGFSGVFAAVCAGALFVQGLIALFCQWGADFRTGYEAAAAAQDWAAGHDITQPEIKTSKAQSVGR
jgi:hypothetical protein